MLAPQRIEGRAVLGIDPGTKLGWALHLPDCSVRSGTVDLPDIKIGAAARGKKPDALRRFLSARKIEAGGRLHAIYYELSQFQGKRKGVVVQGPLALMDRGGLLDVITAFGYFTGSPCHGIAPGTIKKFCTGNGNATKAEVMDMVTRGWKFEPGDDNEADALAIMCYGLEQQQCAA